MRIASRKMLINQRAMFKKKTRGSVYLNYFREEIVVVVAQKR